MSSTSAVETWDEEERVGDELAALHQAYLSSIRQHRVLMGDLCQTLSHLADAIDASGLSDAIGTVAGDNTIIVVAREGVSGAELTDQLRSYAMEGAA